MTEGNATADWSGPATGRRDRRPFRWRNVVWGIIYPGRHQHLAPTVSGLLLIVLSLGIGTAAYNAANNILFITLALLLACLTLSGVLSWFNFAKLRWRLLFPAAARAGEPFTVTLELANDKSLLPAYGLECHFTARPLDEGGPAVPQMTFTARGRDVKAILQRANDAVTGSVAQSGRLDPWATLALDWTWTPERRGRWEVELAAVGSLFPFGFFHKKLGAHLRRVVIIRPAPVDYQLAPASAPPESGQALRLARLGGGSDLLALRAYAPGDSHRLIHWKASARGGRLLVRQFAAEATEHFALHLPTDAATWPRAEQFEKAVSLAAALVDDLFRSDRLRAVCFDDEPVRPVRHMRDFDGVLDALALRPRVEDNLTPPAAPPPRTLTLQPDGATGVVALCDGKPAATA